MYDTGVWSVRLLIVTIAVPPVLVLINRFGQGNRPGQAFGRWLLKRRRHFGLGIFIYAALHLLHYTLETADIESILQESIEIEFTVGWLGFFIFLALALTSNSWSVRKLGHGWKKLHYWLYPAAALSFLHWYLFDYFTERVLFWIAIFAAIKLAHSAFRMIPRNRKAVAGRQQV